MTFFSIFLSSQKEIWPKVRGRGGPAGRKFGSGCTLPKEIWPGLGGVPCIRVRGPLKKHKFYKFGLA